MTDQEWGAMTEDSKRRLVEIYQANVADWKQLADDRIDTLTKLVRDLVYTARSGTLAADNVAALTERAKKLGAYK